jgi:hypothetical protein
MITQKQMFYQEQKKLGEVNEVFLHLVRDGMIKEELARNIERRPSLWCRFAGFMSTLPSAKPVLPRSQN